MRVLTALTIIVFFAVTAFAVAAFAGQFSDLKMKIEEARKTLVTMVQQKDKRGPDQQKVVKETAEAVSAAISSIKAPAGKEAQFSDLVSTWNAFKKTREEDIVPMLLENKEAEAKKLATGIQQERLKKLLVLCDALDK
ncbi:MAG: hypothetical protein LLF86_02615 [Nitrospiraceae bacterium]|nr:hypothetical protein [Nitrospiraceae bacterium]